MNEKDNLEPMKIQFEQYLVQKNANQSENQTPVDRTDDKPKTVDRKSPIPPLVVKSYTAKIAKKPKNQDDIKLKMKYYIRRLKIARRQSLNKK